MGFADLQWHGAIFVRKHDAHLAPADADASDLAYRLIPQRSRHAERNREIRTPDRLGAGGPSPDPIAHFRRLERRGERQERLPSAPANPARRSDEFRAEKFSLRAI